MALLFAAASAQAQETMQVSIGGIPPILPSPYISDIEDNYYQGQYHVQLTYNSTNPKAAAFTWEVRLTHNGEELLRASSEPVWYEPGSYYYVAFDDNPQVLFTGDLYDYFEEDIVEEVIRTGLLKEGSYELEIDVVAVDAFRMVSSIPGYAWFEVRYPQPPLLISPIDEGLAPQQFAVFSWTPVIPIPGFQFEYELLIVALEDGQLPLQAIQANQEHVLATTTQPVFIHTQDELPFDLGQEYAWRIRAYEIDDLIPVSDEGLTEIFTFTVGDFFVDIDELESIQLIPGFAEIVNLDQLDIEPDGLYYVVNGQATLRIHMPETGQVDITIFCDDLQVSFTSEHTAVAMGGSVSGNVEAEIFPQQGIGDIVTLNSIQWSMMEGLTVDAEIIDPTGQYLEAEGMLNLGPAGFSGQITATGPAGVPLFEFGANPLELTVQSITAHFPGAYLTMDAGLTFFSEPTPCQITELVMSESPTQISFSCNIGHSIPLVPDTDLAALYLHQAMGSLEIDWGDDAGIAFDIQAGGAIHLGALYDDAFEIPMMASVSSDQGVTIQAWPAPLMSQPPPIDLGIAQLTIQSIQDPYVSYDHTTNTWDFGIDLDASLTFPDFDDLKIPGFAGITLDKQGIHFPMFHFQEDQLMWIPPLELAGFGARLTSFTLPAFTFPWFDWDGMMPGPWDFYFDFELTTPNFANHLPACLRNLTLHIENASFTGRSFSAQLPTKSFPDGTCSYALGAGYALQINQLGGSITGIADATSFSLTGYLALDAEMTLGTPFDCDGASAKSVSAENLQIRGDGILKGEFTNIIPTCPLNIGPYTARITESLLSFYQNDNSQQASFDATAYLELPAQVDGITNEIHGELGLNLMTGKFHTLHFHIDEPFTWNIPADEPVLQFQIDEAIISQDGFFINGAQEFLAGETAINVVFNDLLLDLGSFQVISGSIDFDTGFAFEAGIDPTDFSLTYQALPHGSGLSEELDPGVFFELAGDIRIDSEGLHASGTADAAIRFSSFSSENLTVNFSEDFAFGLDPFQVASGEIEVVHDGATVAIIDAQGFHPSFDFINIESLIPERLPLPSHSVAYLQIKDGEELLVQIDPHPELDFAVVMNTIEGEQVDFVFPVLQGDLETPPAVGVEFSDLVFSLSPLGFESGEVGVSITDADEFFDLSRFGIPLSLKQVYYGVVESESYHADGLFFSGELTLFEQELGEQAFTSFRITSNGVLEGWVALQDMEANVPLVPGSDLAVLQIHTVNGYGQYDILNPTTPPAFSFDIESSFLLQVDEDHYAGAAVDISYDQHMLTTDFRYHMGAKLPEFDLHPFVCKVNAINSLSLDYDKTDGFDFYAALDFEFGLILDEDSLMIPMQGVEVRPTGFVIPAQEVHDGTNPPLAVPAIEMLGFRLEPLAFRTHDVVVDFFDFSPGDLAGLIPRMDLAVSFPGLEELAPAMEGLSLTVIDAGYQNGFLTGEVEVYEPFVPITIPFGDNELELERFRGALSEIMEEGIPAQAIHIEVEGEIPPFTQFDSDVACDPVAFAFSIIQGSGLRGSIENLIPCGEIALGKMALSFPSSSLEMDFIDNAQRALLSGNAQLSIPREGQPPINIQGALSYDLIENKLSDGALEITESFQWGFPADEADPFLVFHVEQARLDADGFTLMAGGSLPITEGMQVDVTFEDLLIDLADLQIKDGEVRFEMADFAFDLMFLPVSWRMVPPGEPVPMDTNVMRLGMADTQIVLDKDGLGFSGEGIAGLHLLEDPEEDSDPENTPEDNPGQDQEISYGDLRMVFKDEFRLNMPPTSQAKSGSVELWLDEGEESDLLAWYDTYGIGFGNLLDLFEIPDTLGLPHPYSHDLAYIVLKEEEELLVRFERGEGVNTLETIDEQSVEIVLACLEDEDGEAPSFRATFSISVNDIFEVTDGTIAVHLGDTEDPLPGNQPLKVPGLPLILNYIQYEAGSAGEPGILSAGALLQLPEALGDLQVVIDEVRLSTEGFEQASFSVGVADFDPATHDPEFHHSFFDDAFVINVFHAEASFGQETAFSFAGTFQSHLLTNESDEPESLPFNASYDHQQGQWDFSLELLDNFDDPYEMGLARLAITNFEVVASSEEVAMILSGVVTLPDLLGDDFSVTIEGLSIGTQGISMEEIESDIQQSLTFFQEKVEVTLARLGAEYQEGVLYVTLNGDLEVLNRTAELDNMRIGTDGSIEFGTEGSLSLQLLENEFELLSEYLVVEQITFGMQEGELEDQNHTAFSLSLDGRAKLPEPVDQETSLQVVFAMVDGELKTRFSGPHFTVDEDQGRFEITEGIVFELTEVKADIDFAHLENNAIMANGKLLLENNEGHWNEISFGTDIDDSPGFRYRVADGVTWNAHGTGTEDNPLLAFHKALFRFNVYSAETYDPTVFGVKLQGSIGLDFTALKMNANFKDMKINTAGIDSWGTFDSGGSITIMNFLSLAVEDFDFAPSGGGLTLMEVAGGADKATEDEIDKPDAVEIETEYHLLIRGATLSISGNSGEGEGSDLFSGGVEMFVFYKCKNTGDLLFQIDNASISLQDHADANLSLKYYSGGDGASYHLSASGSVEVFEQRLGMAGMIENDNGTMRFGLYVQVNFTPGVPVLIPNALTITGLGGGFYYNPRQEDFDTVYGLTQMTFHDDYQPEFDEPSFAAFLYASASIIELTPYDAIDGAFFMEITSGRVAMHVDGEILGQGDSLAAQSFLLINWGADPPYLQGGLQVGVDYGSPLNGHGKVAFFVGGDGIPPTWAVWGGTQINFFILETESGFIVSNEGLYVDFGTDFHVEKSGWYGSWEVIADIDAELWYMRADENFGAYASLYGLIDGPGIKLEAELLGAYVSMPEYNLFYAQGCGSYEVVLLGSGSACGNVSFYDQEGWSAGKGTRDDMVALIDDARQNAEAMEEVAMEIQNDVDNMMAEIEAAANVEEIMEHLENLIGGWYFTVEPMDKLQGKLDHINEMAPEVNQNLASLQATSIDMLIETETLAADLENPVTFMEGMLSGETITDLHVAQSPQIQVSSEQQTANIDLLLEDLQTREQVMQQFEENIAKALANLAKLEMLMEGFQHLSLEQAYQFVDIIGDEFQIHLNTFSSGFESPGAGHFHFPEFGNPYNPFNLNHFAEEYALAVSYLKEFYAKAIATLWSHYYVYQHDPNWQTATMNLIPVFADHFDEVYGKLILQHEAYTQSLEYLYDIKGQMITNIHSMIVSYVYHAMDYMDDQQLASMQEMETHMAQALEPPVIHGFNWSTTLGSHETQFNYFAKPEIFWQASHPQQVIENSYSISQEGIGLFTSSGSMNSLTHHSFKRNLGHHTNHYNVAVRARGSGGNTNIGMANVSVAVKHPDGTSTPDGELTPDDVPPPSTPHISFPYNNRLITFPGQIMPITLYYTKNPSRIDLTISAYAASSDIVAFEYALGSHHGGTDVVDWTGAVGVVELLDVTGGGGITRKINTSIHNLALEHGEVYYVSVRAYNVHGDYSEHHEQRKRVLYDGLPPPPPSSVTLVEASGPEPSSQSQWPTYAQVASPPQWEHPKFSPPCSHTPPAVTFQWGHAVNAASGILGYEYVLTDIADPGLAFQDEASIRFTNENEVTMTEGLVSYTVPRYFHIRSKSNVGSYSEQVVTIDQVTAKDLTPPSSPVVKLRLFGPTLRLHIPALAVDPESQVIGYEYSIGGAPDLTDFRDWGKVPGLVQDTEFLVVHYPGTPFPVPILYPEPTTVPQVNIPVFGLPQQTTMYLNVRAINAAGMVSDIASSGPFQLGTVPDEPVVNLDYQEETSTLQVTLGKIHDPGAAIHQVSYRIKVLDTGNYLPWVHLSGLKGFHLGPASHPPITNSVPQSESGYQVQVDVTNTAMQTTSTVKEYTHPIEFTPANNFGQWITIF